MKSSLNALSGEFPSNNLTDYKVRVEKIFLCMCNVAVVKAVCLECH